jgi:hypothetical protein
MYNLIGLIFNLTSELYDALSELCLRFPTVEPTSEPLEVTVDDKSDTSVTITWRPPKTIPANSGLDGYTVEITKEGSKLFKPTTLTNLVPDLFVQSC